MMLIVALLLASGMVNAQSYDRVRVRPFDRTFRVDFYPEDDDRPYRVVFYDDGLKSKYRFNDEGLVRAIRVEDENFSVLYTSRNELKRVEGRDRRRMLAVEEENEEEYEEENKVDYLSVGHPSQHRRLYSCAECSATWILMCGPGVDSVCDLVDYGDVLSGHDVVTSINIMCTEFEAACDALTAAQACSEECGTVFTPSPVDISTPEPTPESTPEPTPETPTTEPVTPTLTCINGLPGIQSKNSCCVLACGQCGGSGCSTANGLSAADCCEGTIQETGRLCDVTGAAPCIVDPSQTPPPAPTPSLPPPGVCDGGIVGIQDKNACCSLGCGQCGGSGCSTAGGLSAAECCSGTIGETGPMCDVTQAAPCILSV